MSRNHCLPFALVVLLAAWLAAPAAQAHAVLVEAEPGDGESVATAPAAVRLRFNEPVTLLSVRLADASGTPVPGISAEAQGERVVVHLPANLAPGGYFLSYRVASIDAHAVGAALRLGIGAPAPGSGPAEAASFAARWTAAAARWLVYATALGSAGLALFVAVTRPPVEVAARAGRWSSRLATAGLLALVLRLGAVGWDLVGGRAETLLTGLPWRTAATTTQGPAAALLAIGLVLLAFRRWSWLAALLIAASFGLTGHAASAQPRWLTGPSLTLHTLAAAFWLGSFLPLAWSLALPPASAASVLRRFSAAAGFMLLALAAAGALLAWVQLGGDIAALWRDAYGQRLLVKLALVAGLLVLAAANRWLLTPRLAASEPTARRSLRASLAADLLLALAVLAITATFPFSPPPRALALAEPETAGIAVVAGAREAQASLTLAPGRAGGNRLTAWVTTPDGVPIAAREASVAWSLPAAGIEPLRVAASLPAPGAVVASGIALPRAGRWRFRLDLLSDDATKIVIEADIDVP